MNLNVYSEIICFPPFLGGTTGGSGSMFESMACSQVMEKR